MVCISIALHLSLWFIALGFRYDDCGAFGGGYWHRFRWAGKMGSGNEIRKSENAGYVTPNEWQLIEELFNISIRHRTRTLLQVEFN